MLIVALTAGAGLSVGLCIRGEYLPSDRLIYVFKPTATSLLIGVALASAALDTGYGRLVAVALVFCLAGDVFLMIPGGRFVQGLVSFLVAHVLLATAFAMQGAGFTWWLLLPVALVGIVVYVVLSPHLGRLKIPVVVYILAISAMAWLSLERWHVQGTASATLAAAGALLFLFSDSVLALDRFRGRFRVARLLVLSSYWTSVWLTALSADPTRL